MKKNLIILIFMLIVMGLITGCTGDMIGVQSEEANSQRELFAFPNTEGVNPSAETDEVPEADTGQRVKTTEVYPSPQLETIEAYQQPEATEVYPSLQPETVSVFENPMVVLVGGMENIPPPAVEVDIDFTLFRGDDFDEEYFQLMWETENSFGKIIRIIGTYDSFFDDLTERYHHFLLIDDAEGCCVLFFEFGWSEGNEPDVFPEEDAIIDLIGVFDEFYCHVLEWSFQFVVVESISVLQRSN